LHLHLPPRRWQPRPSRSDGPGSTSPGAARRSTTLRRSSPRQRVAQTDTVSASRLRTDARTSRFRGAQRSERFSRCLSGEEASASAHSVQAGDTAVLRGLQPLRRAQSRLVAVEMRGRLKGTSDSLRPLRMRPGFAILRFLHSLRRASVALREKSGLMLLLVLACPKTMRSAQKLGAARQRQIAVG
jgi:hypothetical protein